MGAANGHPVPTSQHKIETMSFLEKFGIKRKERNVFVRILDRQSYAEAIKRPGIQLIDVRTPSEYQAGHIEKALNIDFYDKQHFEERAAQLDPKTPTYLYCRSGARSQRAARMLSGMGFESLYDLKGGYLTW